LVQVMLHAHPDIAIPPENRFLLEVYDRREAFGDLRELTNRRKLAKFIVKRQRSRLDDLGPPPRRTRQRIVAAPTIGSAVATVLRDYAARKVRHARTDGEIDGAAVGRRRRDLEPWELDLFEFVAARQLAQHGYALSRGRRPLPPPWPLLRFTKLSVRRALHRRRALRRDARRRRHHDLPLASTIADQKDD
jgi:hypothetical protein